MNGEGDGVARITLTGKNLCDKTGKATLTLNVVIDDPYRDKGQVAPAASGNGYLLINDVEVPVANPDGTVTVPKTISKEFAVDGTAGNSGEITIRAVNKDRIDPDDKSKTGVIAVWRLRWKITCDGGGSLGVDATKELDGDGGLPMKDSR